MKTPIKKILVQRGNAIWNGQRAFYSFTRNAEADQLLNNLKGYPHAFVIACIMDRQMKAERAWLIPYLLAQKIGGFEFQKLERLSSEKIRRLMTRPKPLHRFPETMSANLYQAIALISREYNGDASRIWAGEPSSAEVVFRLLRFPGIGPKIATMGANILARHLKIKFSDYYSIDISVDVHVRRVFSRLGLAPATATIEELVYRSRALNPSFPGILDLPAWEIGRNWCRPSLPVCGDCYMDSHCPRVGVVPQGKSRSVSP